MRKKPDGPEPKKNPEKQGPPPKRKGMENLIPIGELSEEEQREFKRRGGIKSGEVRREKKLMKDTLKDLLAMPLKDGDIAKIRTLAEARGKNLTVQEAILLSQVRKAISGNVQSAQFIRDTMGQKPVEEVNVTQVEHNPFKGLTTEELRAILFENDESGEDS